MRNVSRGLTAAANALLLSGQQALIRRGILPTQQRTGVPVTDTGDLGGILDTPPEVKSVAAEQFIPAILPGSTEYLVRRRIVVPQGNAAAAVGEKKPIPVVRLSFDLAGMEPTKIATVSIWDNEAVLAGGSVVARGLQDKLTGDVTGVANRLAVSLDAASAVAPAGLGYGATIVPSSGNLADGVAALFLALGAGVNPATLAFVTDCFTAALLGTATDANGGLLFPGVGVLGGEILGVPVLVTRGSTLEDSPPEGRLMLIDGSAVVWAITSVEWSTTDQATLELSDAPTGDGDTPASMSQERVSLFQNDLSAFLCIMRCSWKVVRSGAVAVLTGI